MDLKIKKNNTKAYKKPDKKNELPWVVRDPSSPYFMTEDGKSWTPIGHNEAMSWPFLVEIFWDPDMVLATDYFRMLADRGVTCIRMMMENCDLPDYMLETKVGETNPAVVFFWDQLFSLAEKFGVRLLLTPFDTFWMWLNWRNHPYNAKNGGPCRDRSHFISDIGVVKAVERRFEFIIRRWGGSGAVFGWDLWNEIHPAYSQEDFKHFQKYLAEISGFIRGLEKKLYGKTHLQTASIFGPLLTSGSTERELQDDEQFVAVSHTIYESKFFDFATIHTYDQGTLDEPKNTVDPAISMGILTGRAIEQIKDDRPYFDTEHGPIHTFKDLEVTLPQDFDEEYFLFTEWAHFASGGAGGGMRWPNRHPHVLTSGMYKAQSSLARFCDLVEWHGFKRTNISRELEISLISIAGFGVASDDQAILWLVRKNTIGANGMLRFAEKTDAEISVPKLKSGTYTVTAWDTGRGEVIDKFKVTVAKNKKMIFTTPKFVKDIALLIQKKNTRKK